MEAIVYEKRPGRWKVTGSSKTFPTMEAALEAAAERFEVVKIAGHEEEPAKDHLDQYEEELIAEEQDPLEALRQARINNGNIEEGSHNDGDHEEQELSESSDRGVFESTWYRSDS